MCAYTHTHTHTHSVEDPLLKVNMHIAKFNEKKQ